MEKDKLKKFIVIAAVLLLNGCAVFKNPKNCEYWAILFLGAYPAPISTCTSWKSSENGPQ